MRKRDAAAALLCTLLILGCNSPAKAPGSARKEIAIGSAAPDFVLRDLGEKTVSLADYSGRVLLLTFWKVKCKDCIKTLPSIDELAQRVNSPDFAILTINVDNLEYVTPEKINAFLKQNRFTFRVAVDETFSASESYKLLAVPMTYLIDKKGVIADIAFGEQDWASRESLEKIRALLR